MGTRIPALLVPPIGFAHRGGRAHARENTIEAFLLAQKMGATGIESDAWITADGVVVLHHDGSVGAFWSAVARRILGRRIAGLPRSRLPSYIPTLEDYYRRCGTDLPLSLDIKDDKAFAGVIELARKYQAAERLWICHGSIETLQAWRTVATEVRLVHSTRLNRLSHGPERHAADLAAAGIDAVNFHCEDWNGGLTTLYHRFGLLALGWDAQQVHQIAELIDAGIDALYGDHVDRITETLAHFFNGDSEPLA